MERNYSDIEALYGKPVVTVKDVYLAMMEIENKWSRAGQLVWEKENPEESGINLEWLESNPLTDCERERVDELGEMLWQMCHQLVHDCILELDESDGCGDVARCTLSAFYIVTDNAGASPIVECFTSRSEGLVWFRRENGDGDEYDDDIDIVTLFGIAQELYLKSLKIL